MQSLKLEITDISTRVHVPRELDMRVDVSLAIEMKNSGHLIWGPVQKSTRTGLGGFMAYQHNIKDCSGAPRRPQTAQSGPTPA